MNNINVSEYFETDRLYLKIISKEYIKQIFKHFSDPEVTKYMDINSLESIEQAEEIIDYYINKEDDQHHYRWVIIRKKDNQFLGTCGINKISKNRANKCEIGYDLSKKYWRKGYTYEVLETIIKHIFTDLKIHRIEAMVIKGNDASCRLLEKLNFKNEGLLRDYHIFNDDYVSEYMYSLLKEEYM